MLSMSKCYMAYVICKKSNSLKVPALSSVWTSSASTQLHTRLVLLQLCFCSMPMAAVVQTCWPEGGAECIMQLLWSFRPTAS